MFAVVVWRSITRSAAASDPFGPNSASTSLARLASTVFGGASSFDRRKHRFRSSSRNLLLASTAAGFPTSVSVLSLNAFSNHTPVYSLPCVPPTTTTLCFAARLTQRLATNIAAIPLLSIQPWVLAAQLNCAVAAAQLNCAAAALGSCAGSTQRCTKTKNSSAACTAEPVAAVLTLTRS